APCCADSIGDVDVIDASVGPAGVIRVAASASSIAMKMPRQILSRPARNRRLALIRSPQPIDIDSLRLRFRICSRILFSYSQDFLRSSTSQPPLPQADGLRDGLTVYVSWQIFAQRDRPAQVVPVMRITRSIGRRRRTGVLP